MNEWKRDKGRRREAGRTKEESSKHLPWQLAESRALRQLAFVRKRVRGNSSEFGRTPSVPVLYVVCGGLWEKHQSTKVTKKRGEGRYRKKLNLVLKASFAS